MKTADASRSFGGWQLDRRQEADERDSLLHGFVTFDATDAPPAAWIRPWAVVASTIEEASAAYLANPKGDGAGGWQSDGVMEHLPQAA